MKSIGLGAEVPYSTCNNAQNRTINRLFNRYHTARGRRLRASERTEISTLATCAC